MTAGPAYALTPVDGGNAGGTAITVNDGAGDQSEPHIGGNLAVYTDRADIFAPGTIHYFDLSTAPTASFPEARPATATCSRT